MCVFAVYTKSIHILFIHCSVPLKLSIFTKFTNIIGINKVMNRQFKALLVA